MPYERLKNATKKTIGTKQTIKAVQRGAALVVYIAKDAEPRVLDPLVKLCQEKGLEVVMVDSMLELGKACGIEVGSASAAVVTD
ncbi:ribosomal L7Ae/L30e/S12e/Gadd45 family protein [Bacillota bacterium LX-D]|nr:ribosomal L7Ae/L30e/S12e/Gadd45 family protein [Bacillota bacterium LX-D]